MGIFDSKDGPFLDDRDSKWNLKELTVCLVMEAILWQTNCWYYGCVGFAEAAIGTASELYGRTRIGHYLSSYVSFTCYIPGTPNLFQFLNSTLLS